MADTKEQSGVPNAKEIVTREAEARKKANEEVAKRMETARPTPTQDENDRARLGEIVENKEDDCSGPDVKLVLTRQVEPDKPLTGYQTRQTQPASSTPAMQTQPKQPSNT